MTTPQSSDQGHDHAPSGPRDVLIETIVRVLVVQGIALAALWFLQSRYGF